MIAMVDAVNWPQPYPSVTVRVNPAFSNEHIECLGLAGMKKNH